MAKKKLENIDERGFIIEISEYGKVVRQYHDTDRKRFSEMARSIINDHLDYSSRQGDDEVKNINFHIFTI